MNKPCIFLIYLFGNMHYSIFIKTKWLDHLFLVNYTKENAFWGNSFIFNTCHIYDKIGSFFVCLFLFRRVLGSRHSITWAMPSIPFAAAHFASRVLHFLFRAGLVLCSSCLHFPSIWDCRCAPLCPTLFVGYCFSNVLVQTGLELWSSHFHSLYSWYCRKMPERIPNYFSLKVSKRDQDNKRFYSLLYWRY
jgi:hypothetical protein